MSEYFILAVLVAHFLSYGLVVWRVNQNIEDKRSRDRIAPFFIGPRSLANLWRQLFGMKFVRSGDLLLIGAGVVHILTTATVFLLLMNMILHDLFA